jgi:hypothetical protein
VAGGAGRLNVCVTDSTTRATATLKLQKKGVIAEDEEEKQEGGVLRRPIRNRKPNSMLSGPEWVKM